MPYSSPSIHSRALSSCMPLVRCRRPMSSRSRAHTSLRIARPPFDSAERGGIQPAAQLRHVQRRRHGLHVPRALRACRALRPQPIADHPHALRSRHRLFAPPRPPFGRLTWTITSHFRRLTRPAHLPARASRPALYMPSFRLGSTHPPCPMPTSCSFVAHGRAPRPLPPLAMARTGGRAIRLSACGRPRHRHRHRITT